MQEIEFDTTIEVNEVEVEVHVTAEFHPSVEQSWDGDGGSAEAVFLLTVTDINDTDILPFLGDYERNILKEQVTEKV